MHIVVGPGDDCAVLRSASGDLQLITVDQLIEGRHFTHGTAIDRIARKIIARSVSDIAAMAGSPTWSLATAALPPDYPHADKLFDAMAKWALHFGCPLVGGDIATLAPPSPSSTSPSSSSVSLPATLHIDGTPIPARPGLMLTCTVAGIPHPRRGPVLRSAALPGDDVWVTGRLGGSFLSGRHLSFEPRTREAHFLADTLGDRLHAMIDLSDGLGRDAARIAEASGVRIELHGPRLPVHPNVHSWDAAIADGEDYELCFTTAPTAPAPPATPHSPASLPEACPHTDTPFTRIGRVVAGAGCVLIDETGASHDITESGWDH